MKWMDGHRNINSFDGLAGFKITGKSRLRHMHGHNENCAQFCDARGTPFYSVP